MQIVENLIENYSFANFTEDEPLWLARNTYLNGQRAREGHFTYKYTGVNGTNTATKPTENPTLWTNPLVTNYYAMLGGKTSEQTKVTGNLIIEVQGLNFDTFALLNIEGTSLIIKLTDNGTSEVVFEETIELLNTDEIIDAFSYYFSPFEFTRQYFNNNIPLVNGTLRIEVLGTNTAIGRLVWGQKFDVGYTMFGSQESLESYSTVITDTEGNTTLESRQPVYNSTHKVKIITENIPVIKRKRKSLDAKPILIVGDETMNSNVENLLSYGLWQNADVTIQTPTTSEINCTVKELL